MSETIVIKIGGAEGNETAGLIQDIKNQQQHGHRVVIVHGGSAETTRLADRLGVPTQFLTSPSGQTSRRCDRETLEIFAQATSLMNRELVEELRLAGVDAFGFSGLDGGSASGKRKANIRARQGGRTIVIRDEWTGRPQTIRTDIFTTLLDLGLTLVVAPILCSEKGEMLNVDGDRLASLIASGLGASTLLFLSNVPGLLRDVEDPSSVVSTITDMKLADSLAEGRMKKKVMAAQAALEGGASRVVIADSRNESPITRALSGAGTSFLRREELQGEPSQ